MRSRWICAFACMVIMASKGMAAESMATLPPYVSPSVQAPTANLEVQMLLPDPRIESIVQVAHDGETIGLVSQAADGANALWLYDAVRGTFVLRYEAPSGYHIVSPVFCAGDCYWSQWRNDSSQGWEIMVLRSETDRIERVRADTYAVSTMAPTLQTDGVTVYWYETDQQKQGEMDQVPVQLYCLGDAGVPIPLFSLQIVDEGNGPAVSEDILAVSRYDTQSGKWSISLFAKTTGEMLAEYAAQGHPTEIQRLGDRMLWLEGETSEAEMGRIAALEEDDRLYELDREWAFDGRLMLREEEKTRVIDTGVERALLLPFGIIYVNASGMLYCYSFLLEQPIRLSSAGDYQPVMDIHEEELLAIRKIWTGEEELYRPEVFNLQPLWKGWPALQ